MLLSKYKLTAFTWGESPSEAVNFSVVMEEFAFMAWHCMALPDRYLVPMQKDLLERHYSRRHNKNKIKDQMDMDSYLS